MEAAIYVGKYEVSEDGIIPLPQKSKIRVLSCYIGIKENGDWFVDDRLTIALEDGDFWPTIIKLTDEEANKLIKAIRTALEYRRKKPLDQITFGIP